jgi:hypothetical protein
MKIHFCWRRNEIGKNAGPVSGKGNLGKYLGRPVKRIVVREEIGCQLPDGQSVQQFFDVVVADFFVVRVAYDAGDVRTIRGHGGVHVQSPFQLGIVVPNHDFEHVDHDPIVKNVEKFYPQHRSTNNNPNSFSNVLMPALVTLVALMVKLIIVVIIVLPVQFFFFRSRSL